MHSPSIPIVPSRPCKCSGYAPAGPLGTVKHAFLGVQAAAGRGGALVRGVQAGTPAAKAGLRPGDVIVSLAGTRVDGPDALVQAVDAHAPGQRVSLAYLRNGTRHTASVRLAAQPDQAP